MLTTQRLRGDDSECSLRKRRKLGNDETRRRRRIGREMIADRRRGEVGAQHRMIAMTAAFVMARLRLLMAIIGIVKAAVAVIERRHRSRAEALAHIRAAPAHRLGRQQQDHQDHAGEAM